jgi:deazaflavin-dependent oxidoreductase (nitroreductase family)
VARERTLPTGYLIEYPNQFLRLALRLPILFTRMGLGKLVSASNVLILTTRGRKTGRARHTAIEYRRHGSQLYVISAWGDRPDWFRNLLIDPHVTVQQNGRTFAARASVVDNSGEALRVLHLFRRTAPFVYEAVLARMTDERAKDVSTLPEISPDVTIVRMEEQKAEIAPLPPVDSDLLWLWPTALIAATTTLALVLLTRSRR